MLLYVKNLSKYWAYFTALSRPFKKIGRIVCSEMSSQNPRGRIYSLQQQRGSDTSKRDWQTEDLPAMRYLFVASRQYF